jgi:hypothetical protein
VKGNRLNNYLIETKLMKQKPFVSKYYKLQKFPGKGGWTYVAVPEVRRNKQKTPFGWIRVKGSIDNYAFKNYHMMPMKNGGLFLPVKAEIRRKIGKKEGDVVKVILFEDSSPLEIPSEFLLCLKDEPRANELFLKLSEGHKKEFINWIYEAKKEETRALRIGRTIDMILKRDRRSTD